MGSITTIGGSEKIGDVKMHAVNAVPPGWLVCDGALISRAAYGALFAAIGVIYGADDGVNTFKLPDLRGEFPRGFDGGRGVDPGRVFGSAQADAFRSHLHAETSGLFATGSTSAVASTPEGSTGSAPTTSSTELTGGSETRPRNVAMLFCIKYAG